MLKIKDILCLFVFYRMKINSVEYCFLQTVNPQVPGSSPGRGANK